MTSQRGHRGTQGRSIWAIAARLGLAHWFFGNLYEAMVDMPRLLADAQPNREPRLLGAGSPLRYYAPVAPVTVVATGATVATNWRSGGDRRVIGTAAAATVTATSLTGYLVRTVNRRLLLSREPLGEVERRAMVKRWHMANIARLVALVIASAAVRRAAVRPQRPEPAPHSASPSSRPASSKKG